MSLLARGLCVSRGGRRVLEDVSLCIEPGQRVAIVGPNGAGKTTLVQSLVGILPAARGNVLLGDRDVRTLTRRETARAMAYVPQQADAVGGFSVLQVVSAGRHPHRHALEPLTTEDAAAVQSAMSACDITALADRPFDELSGGERQRVHIAAALAQESPILLLDEPAAALDPRHQAELCGLLRKLTALGRTIVIVAHDLNFAAAVADSAIALKAGRIVYHGPMAGLLTVDKLADVFETPFEVIAPDQTASAAHVSPIFVRSEGANAPRTAHVTESPMATASITRRLARAWVMPVLCVMFLAVLLGLPWVGNTVRWPDVESRWTGKLTTVGTVFWTLSVPRVAMGALAGAALAVAGVVFQATFRNPLAEPFTLGVSSGAAVGATLALQLGWTRDLLGMPAVTWAAALGAAISICVVYGLVTITRRASSNTLLLAGVSMGFVCSAAVLLIQYLSLGPVTNSTVRWMMGSVSQVGYGALLAALPAVVVGLGVVWYLQRDLDLLMMGELIAAGRGVAVGRARTAAYFAASLMTAAVVAHCGPIAFVGLIVPHVVRNQLGPAHARLLPASALCGATFLMLSDHLAANVMTWLAASPLQVPVGVVTNLVGGLFFLSMLLRR